MTNFDPVGDWRIRINGNEHGVPHVHVLFKDGSRVSVAIETREVLTGGVTPAKPPCPGPGRHCRQPPKISGRIPETESMKTPPNLLAARIVGELTVEIDWSTGETLRADLSGLTAPPFDALRDPAFFSRMTRDDWGHGLDWPGGIDLGADNLYELCREQAGLPTATEFDRWMQRNKLSLAKAAETLGMTRRMIAHYRTGSRPIPKVVGLACKGWEAEQARRAG